ncbi:MAG: ABC transporter permease [Coriobacteriales bacterium]|nr:ABC transporter permease [Coriobacteriales bacterium]
MTNAIALAKRIIQQFIHDPRTVVLFILAPCVALWLFSVIMGSPSYSPKLAGVDLPQTVVQVVQEQDCTLQQTDAAQASDMLANQQVDATLQMQGQTLQVTVEGADASKTSATVRVMQTALQQAIAQERQDIQQKAEDKLSTLRDNLQTLQDNLSKLQTQLGQLPNGAAIANNISIPSTEDLDASAIADQLQVSSMDVEYLHGSASWNGFSFYGPVLIGIFVFAFIFITSGMSLVTERTGGTMGRLLATPIKPWQLVLGYVLGFGLVSFIQAGIIISACIWLIGFPNEGSLAIVLLLTVSLTFVSLTLGLLVSSLARTSYQVIQLMIILVVPQILLSGVFDLSGAPVWLQGISACFPLTYGASALRNVMLRGEGIAAIAPNLLILWGFVVVFFILASVAFARRQRT